VQTTFSHGNNVLLILSMRMFWWICRKNVPVSCRCLWTAMEVCLLKTLWPGNHLQYSATALVALPSQATINEIHISILIFVQCKQHCLQYTQYSYLLQPSTLVFDEKTQGNTRVTIFIENTHCNYCNVVTEQNVYSIVAVSATCCNSDTKCYREWWQAVVLGSDQAHHSLYTAFLWMCSIVQFKDNNNNQFFTCIITGRLCFHVHHILQTLITL
jgi:hypothetical protein